MENAGLLINKSAKLGFLLMMLSRAYGQLTRKYFGSSESHPRTPSCRLAQFQKPGWYQQQVKTQWCTDYFRTRI